jgi:hypothetical protein
MGAEASGSRLAFCSFRLDGIPGGLRGTRVDVSEVESACDQEGAGSHGVKADSEPTSVGSICWMFAARASRQGLRKSQGVTLQR